MVRVHQLISVFFTALVLALSGLSQASSLSETAADGVFLNLQSNSETGKSCQSADQRPISEQISGRCDDVSEVTFIALQKVGKGSA